MLQLPSLAWLGCESQAKPNGCSFLSERVGVKSSIESISPVIFRLEPELLFLKVKTKPKETPPSHRDGGVHASVGVGVSAGPGSPALGGAAAVLAVEPRWCTFDCRQAEQLCRDANTVI